MSFRRFTFGVALLVLGFAIAMVVNGHHQAWVWVVLFLALSIAGVLGFGQTAYVMGGGATPDTVQPRS